MLLMKFTFKKGIKAFCDNKRTGNNCFSPFSAWRETLQKLIFEQTFYSHLHSCIKIFFLYNKRQQW